MDVLLVDDSRVMRQLVRRTLRQAGYELGQVVEAENGKDALEKLAGWRPELVLSDWNMPEMSGIELLDSLRAKGNGVPLAFVTSESTSAMRSRATSSGALFLVTKPFTAEDFRHALMAAGIRPSAALTGSGGAALQNEVFSEKSVATMIGRLVSQAVTVSPGPKLIPAASPCVSATWVTETGEQLYAGFCELSTAAYLGTAMGLRPVGSVKDVLATRALPEMLQGDVREVFNVMSRSFNDCGSIHVKLGQISFPPAPPIPSALQMDAKAGARRDYMLAVQGYGSGRLSFVSANPKFIVQPG